MIDEIIAKRKNIYVDYLLFKTFKIRKDLSVIGTHLIILLSQ